MSKPTRIVTLAIAAVLALTRFRRLRPRPATSAPRRSRLRASPRAGRHAARPSRLVAGPDLGLAGAECLHLG